MAKKRRLKGASKLEFEIGSGNVYKDLGFRDADAMLAKARIVVEISRIVCARRLTKTAAAKILGLSQPEIAALLDGHFRGDSQEQLIWLLSRLGCDVEIIVKLAPRRRTNGKVSIAFA
ncbi:MAG: helix-turn-helix domain-containing protein [Burkholderiales bacterium]